MKIIETLESRELLKHRIKIMSDNIPFEIQTDIIERITDTKSLIRCRSVSKAWKSMIDSKEFVSAHILRHHQANRHLLIRKQDCGDTEVKYDSIVDDDTFPHQMVSVFVPDSVDTLSCNDSIILGSCHGLLCLYDVEANTAVIWNPCIRKTVAIELPNVLPEHYYRTVVGFGVCPRKLDPKFVKITYVNNSSALQDVNASTQVEVFTLSSGGTWRSPLSSKLPHKSIGFGYSQVVIDGFIYWDAADRINVDDRPRNPKLIMSFNLTTEEFTKLNLPGHLAHKDCSDLSLSNLRQSLVVLELEFNFNRYNQRPICHVWTMIAHGSTRFFSKLYTINAPGASICTTLGFRKSGAPIIELQNDDEDYDYAPVPPTALAIYEPESGSITNIGIHGINRTFFVHSYMETLLLLCH